VECKVANQRWYGLVGLIGLVIAFGLLIYLLCSRTCARGDKASGDELSFQLSFQTDNPLTADAGSGLRHSTRSSLSHRARKTAERSGNVYLLLRVLYQPVRIIVGYIQVVTQIPPVLDLDFPPGIQQILGHLKPLAVDLQSVVQLDCLAGTQITFYGFWIVRCFVLPALMMGVVGLQYAYERQRVDRSTTLGYFKANTFVVIFLCYPGACNQAFSMFNCRELDGGLSVLHKDYSISCTTDQHYWFALVAAAYVGVVSFGIPIYMVFLMVRRMREYAGASASDRFVARRVADELQVADHVAADAIRDVTTGREYSFLVGDFIYVKPVSCVSTARHRRHYPKS
jgi:hypothetical protein